jgi:hypothetical protein
VYAETVSQFIGMTRNLLRLNHFQVYTIRHPEGVLLACKPGRLLLLILSMTPALSRSRRTLLAAVKDAPHLEVIVVTPDDWTALTLRLQRRPP